MSGKSNKKGLSSKLGHFTSFPYSPGLNEHKHLKVTFDSMLLHCTVHYYLIATLSHSSIAINSYLCIKLASRRHHCCCRLDRSGVHLPSTLVQMTSLEGSELLAWEQQVQGLVQALVLPPS